MADDELETLLDLEHLREVFNSEADTSAYVLPVPSASPVLTADDIRRGIETCQQRDYEGMEAQARKAEAWASLRLDYDSMSFEERVWLAYAQASYAMHPNDARKVEEIVERYRRDR